MMNDRLSLLQITALAVYSMGMAGGQILFKLAAVRSMPSRSLAERALDLIQNGYFLAALVLYSVLSVLWVWILSVTPLSRAYPFVALAFVLTPLLGGLLFDEAISIRLLGGMALILCGLFLVTT
jgi:drug/metabolite transporter (DMT)-like permease